MKLWDKNYQINKEIEKYTIDNDYILDKEIIHYDLLASIAHAKMLNKINLITENELEKLLEGLNEIILLNQNGKFEIKFEDEDCHTAIEKYLTNKYGDVGKKIHTARSRNDQVLVAIRLYEKEKINQIQDLIKDFIKIFEKFKSENNNILFPGYTHMQKAMPSSIELWSNAFIDSMKDNLILLDSTLKLINQNPLGTAAGYGVPIFNLDKEYTTKELGFEKVQENSIYAQISRGKFESVIINTLSQIMFDLNKLATDLITFSMQEFKYFSLPIEFCTGSSIMPQKKNPDVLELLRAKYHIILGEEFKIKSVISNLISGYNRDLQLTKEPTIKSINITISSLKIATLIVLKLKVNKLECKKAMTTELYATEDAYKLVLSGVPFREAYREVSKKFI